MGVLTDFVLADRAEADAVAQSNDPVSRWGGFQEKGVMSTDLCALYALLKGEDPDQPASPPRTFTNPFTKKEVAVTVTMVLHQAFESVADDGGEVCVERLPDDLLQRLATASEGDLRAVASPWADTYEHNRRPTPDDVHAFLVSLAALARRSIAESKSVLLWTSP